jgi:hypothetical protein
MTSIHDRNLAAAVDPSQVRPYASPDQHLRDELWRVWLRVEHETRRRWELQALPPAQREGSLGTWQPTEINGLFRQAHAELTGAPTGGYDHGARETLDAYLRHSALVELRVEHTLGAGLELPLIELVRAFGLDGRQRQTLTLAVAAELDDELDDVAQLLALTEPGVFPDELVDRCAAALRNQAVLVVVQGQRGIGKRTLIASAAQRWGQRVLALDAGALSRAQPIGPVLHAVVRELRLLDAIPALVELDEVTGRDSEVPPVVGLLAAMWPGPIAVTLASDKLPPLRMRPVIHLVVPTPSLPTRSELWRRALPELDDGVASELAERFAVTGGVIEMSARAASVAGEPLGLEALDLAVRNQLYGRLQRLGKPLDTPFAFDDIVADADTRAMLREVVAAIRERRRVREDWGFRGAAGISVLFSGSPGVGKTMSATVIARELGLSIYEIDLSQVMSKWVGETAKNLAEIFDAAEPGHVVLLFNEADSLFGKRTTEVNSANDRFANLEVNYFLQRLERFNGVSILTTNLAKAIDAAFRRRFAYDVQFAFPAVDLREELWRRAFPQRARTHELVHKTLAERYELSGGYIKVAAERAAFIAASRQEPITMAVLTATIDRMYRERGKLSTVGKLE